MVDIATIQKQLADVGMTNKYWGRAEILELRHILREDEKIVNAIMGRYEGGFALLLATDRRMLLIDKKPWFLGLEDMRYDMIIEVDYSSQVLEACLTIRTISKTLKFTSFRQRRLRQLTGHIQEQVMRVTQAARQQHVVPEAEEAAAPSGSIPQQLLQRMNYISPRRRLSSALHPLPRHPEHPVSLMQQPKRSRYETLTLMARQALNASMWPY